MLLNRQFEAYHIMILGVCKKCIVQRPKIKDYLSIWE